MGSRKIRASAAEFRVRPDVGHDLPLSRRAVGARRRKTSPVLLLALAAAAVATGLVQSNSVSLAAYNSVVSALVPSGTVDSVSLTSDDAGVRPTSSRKPFMTTFGMPLLDLAPATGEAVAVPEVPAILSGPSRDPDEIVEFGTRKLRRGLVDVVVDAARATDGDAALLMAIADTESSFSTSVKARTSSAEGLFQFIESTWLRTVKDFGGRHGLGREADAVELDEDGDPEVADAATRTRILALRRDPRLASLMASEMLKRDAVRISTRIGRPLTSGEVYIAHFLGPDDAEEFLSHLTRTPGTLAAKLLPGAARANRPIFFVRRGRSNRAVSVASVHRHFETMIGAKRERFASVADLVR